ncbi:DUF551 domain-containing protein [Salmonella enterica subsp. enterica serovar Braenderup]|nr:DUF551 domain-containing protein [Salmonella enterica subsp. enterica serovar Braenderup]
MTITKERLLKIQHWRETYGADSNVMLPAEEAEELARIALAALEAAPEPVVPESISVRQAISALESADCVTTIGQAYKMGWNACRAAMLQGSQPVSNRDELQVIGWLRSDYNSDDKRDPDAPLFMLGSNNPSETWGVKYMPLTGNSPVTPDGWISCSERMPNDKDYVWCWGKSYGWTECDTFEGYYDWSRNKWWAVTDDVEEPASKVTHWMLLPEPPQQEVK